MAAWTMFKCDYLAGAKFCTRMFRTTLDGGAARREAATYGWTANGGDIRCREHVGLANPERPEVTA